MEMSIFVILVETMRRVFHKQNSGDPNFSIKILRGPEQNKKPFFLGGGELVELYELKVVDPILNPI